MMVQENLSSPTFLELIFILSKFICSEEIDSQSDECYLGKSERASFVKVVLKLIDRGQYSKNEALAETVSVATSVLSYIEPSLVLPFIASRFRLALETVSISALCISLCISQNTELSICSTLVWLLKQLFYPGKGCFFEQFYLDIISAKAPWPDRA